MKKIYMATLLLMIFGCMHFLAAQSSKDFKVIVNSENKIDNISKNRLNNIFMKKVTQWSDGDRILPVNLDAESYVRKAFSKSIHNKDVDAVQAYWRKQIFSGSSIPPVEKMNTSQVIDYVKNNPGAIGYISSKSKADGVKEIKVTY
ncbi:MAG: substrate-binding domain-containing protein [Calditrichaceae bacterium]